MYTLVAYDSDRQAEIATEEFGLFFFFFWLMSLDKIDICLNDS